MISPLDAAKSACQEPAGETSTAIVPPTLAPREAHAANLASGRTSRANRFVIVLLAAVLIGITALVYLPSTSGVFLLDDENNIIQNQALRTLVPLSAHLMTGMRGLTTLSFAINYHQSGLEVQDYHRVNITIHALAAFFLFGWLSTLMRQILVGNVNDQETGEVGSKASALIIQANGLAFAVAMIWAVHPLNTQAVTYIVQRAESLAGMFFFLFMWLFSSSTYTKGRVRIILSIFAWLAAVLGLLSKETMVMAVPIAILMDRTFYSESWSSVFTRRKWLWSALIVPGILLGPKVMQMLWASNATGGFSVGGITWWEYVRTQPSVMVHYLRLILIPYPQCFDYGWSPEPLAAGLLMSWGIVGALVAACIYSIRNGQKLGFWGLAAIFYLLPTTLVPLQDLAAEHRMYVPLALIIVPLVTVGGRLFDQATNQAGFSAKHSYWTIMPKAIAMAGIVSVMATMTISRNKLYDSAVAMWTDVVTYVENSDRGGRWLGRAYANLGEAYGDIGKWEESLQALESAQLQEKFPPHVLLNRIRAYIALGRFAAAEQSLQAALLALPNSASLKQQAGIIAATNREFTKAIACFQEARMLAPNDADIVSNLALALAQSGSHTQAKEAYRDALELDPRHVQARRRLLELMLDSGELSEAKLLVESLVQIEGNSSEAAWLRGLINYAESKHADAIKEWSTIQTDFPPRYWVYVGNAKAGLGDFDAAVKAFQNELISNPSSAEALLKLSGYFAQTDPIKSVPYFERILLLKPESSELRLSFAVALARSGKVEQAERQVEKVLESKPNFQPAIQLLERLKTAPGA